MFLVRAGGDGDWELWTLPEGGKGVPHLLQRLAAPGESPGRAVVALPAPQVLAVPSWVATGDREVAPELMRLRLEERGLLPRAGGGGVAADLQVLATRENRSLTLATVLQPDFPESLAFERAVRFEPSAFTLPLLADRLTLWREAGRLTLAVTRGRDLVYTQALNDADLGAETVGEIHCALLQLEGQGLLNPLQGAVLWGEFAAERAEALGKRLGLRVTTDGMPPPTLPPRASRLLPPAVEALHTRKRRRDRVRRLVVTGILLYLGAIAAFAAYLAWEQHASDVAAAELGRQSPTVRAIQDTADRWRNVQAAVDPRVYPVELFSQIASLLPPEGMRLTAFEVQKGKVIVRGEASTAPAAFQFVENVRGRPELALFNWQMPSPSLRPDGRADFAIEGELKGAKAN